MKKIKQTKNSPLFSPQKISPLFFHPPRQNLNATLGLVHSGSGRGVLLFLSPAVEPIGAYCLIWRARGFSSTAAHW